MKDGRKLFINLDDERIIIFPDGLELRLDYGQCDIVLSWSNRRSSRLIRQISVYLRLENGGGTFFHLFMRLRKQSFGLPHLIIIANFLILLSRKGILWSVVFLVFFGVEISGLSCWPLIIYHITYV